jgi:small conductance mechanosensitive channel
VDVSVGIAYGADLQKAVKAAMDLMSHHELVLDDPAPAVVATEMADSSVNLDLRAWTNTENYWSVKGDLTSGVWQAYSRAGIEIPFPQVDVHVRQQ